MKDDFRITITGQEDGHALSGVEIDMSGDVTAIVNALEVALCSFIKSEDIPLRQIISSLKKAYRAVPEREEK